MDKPKTTPKDFFLWAGAMIALYAGAVSFIALIFDYINYAFPNVLDQYIDPYQGGVSYEMASLIVLAPVFLILMRIIRRAIAADPSRSEIWVRRWALFLILFAAGAAIVIDLIVLLTTFLGGDELTARFLLKVAVVLLVAAAGFMHFIADVRGYWGTFPERARRVSWGVAVLIVLTIAAGFFIIGTPGQARQHRLDERRVTDLENIQYQVINYWQLKQMLPASLSDLEDPISGFRVPLDPQTGEQYSYTITGASAMAFELCANFSAPGRAQGQVPAPVIPGEKQGVQTSWQHGAGTACFERAIDPELYPPIKRP